MQVDRRRPTETGTTISFLADAEIFDETVFDATTLALALPRDGVPDARPAHHVHRRARRRRQPGRVPLRGRHQGLRLVHQRVEGRRAPARRLLLERHRPGRGRGRDAVEHLLPGVRLLVRQQRQHARGRLAPLRLPLRAHVDAQQVRARQGPAEGEGGQPRGRGRARGPRRCHLRQAAGPAVRGPDEDEARQPVGHRPRLDGGQPEARRVLRGEPDRRAPDHQQGDRRAARAAGGAQGARADAAQVGARVDVAAGQARRLLDQGSRQSAELFIVEGDSAGGSAKMGRDRTYQAILPLRGKIINSEKNRINKVLSNNEIQAMITAIGTGDRRRVRPREAPLSPRDRDDGRRRRRLAHPHADPHVPLPADAGADRAGPRLHRRAAALQGEARQPGVLLREGRAARGAARARAHPERRGHVTRRRRREAHRGEVEPRSSKDLQQYEGYYARLRSDFGAAATELMILHRLVEHEIEAPERPRRRAIDAIGRERLRALDARARRRGASACASSRPRRRPAATSRVPVELLASPIYARPARRVHRSSSTSSAQPPFTVGSARRPWSPSRSTLLRERVLDAAKQGIQVSRFKGLGEMNAEQLWETTMDPAKRLLMRVDVEDASAADRVFSKLMGDAGRAAPRVHRAERKGRQVPGRLGRVHVDE